MELKIRLGVEFDGKADTTKVEVPVDKRVAAKLFVVITDACVRMHGDDFPELVEDMMVEFIEQGLHTSGMEEIIEEDDDGIKN